MPAAALRQVAAPQQAAALRQLTTKSVQV